MKLDLRCLLFLGFFAFSLGLKAGCVLNAAPVAVEDEGFTYQDNSTTGDLSENDFDPDGDALTYSLISGTVNGITTIYPNGTYLFVPNQYYFGVTSMTYQVCDGNGGCDIGLLMMYVPFLNDPPQANDDILMVEVDEGRFGNARTNDYEPDLEILFYSRLVGPFNGTVTFNVNGTFFYIPNPGFTGTDMIVYQACDPCFVCDQATINITVTGPNEDPSATPSLNNPVNEDTQLIGNLSGFVSDPENDPLIFSLQSPPSQGSVTISQSGSFLFIPAPNFSGNVTFNYLACDVFGQCALGNYGINVLPINDAPIAINDNFSANEDTQVSGSVAANDIDSDSPTLTYTQTTVSTNGILLFNNNGSFTFTPNANWFGQEVISYQLCDNLSLCANATLTINIVSVNDSPVAVDDFASGVEDVPVVGTVANDSDIESSILIYSAQVTQANGTITMFGNGTFTYFPNENFFGTEAISYSVCDGNGSCDQGTLTVTINYVTDQPVVINENFLVNEDNILSGDVSLNDDSNGEGSLIYSIVSTPANGITSMNANGTFVYTPAANWFGTVAISYLGCNGSNVCDSGILTIIVQSVNDAVVALDGSANTQEDATLSGNLNLLASDLEDAVLNYSITIQPQFGTISLGLNGAFVYQSLVNYFGADQFTYTACDLQGSCDAGVYFVTVLSVNDAPVAEYGESYTGEDNAFVWFLPEATDADGDELTYSLVTPPSNATVAIQPNGTYSFTPDFNFHGIDTLTYRVCDELGACDDEIVVVYVFSINDDPVAVNDNNTISANSMLYGTVAANDYDTDIEPLTFITLDAADFGTFVLNMNGTYTYISNLDYEGLETIIYYACDSCGACAIATLTITVVLVNTPPMLSSNENKTTNEDVLLTGDLEPLVSDAEGGDLIFSILTSTLNGSLILSANGSYSYAPNLNYNGPDQFVFRVCDTGGLCTDGIATITVNPIDDIPVAVADNFSLNEDQIYNGSVALNDFDFDDDDLIYSIIMPPLYGSFTLNSVGAFMYHPAANYYGNDQMTYSVCDSQNACAQTTLSFVVVSVNDLPTVNDSEIITDEEVLKTGSLVANAQDIDDNVLTYSIVTLPINGQLTISPNGNYSYNPNYNFSGMDEFVYRACDNGGLCGQATVSVTVNFVNDLPIVLPESFTGVEDQIVTGSVADNDTDPDIEGLVWVVLFGPQRGVASMNFEGQFVYTPNANYFGQDALTYMACDSCGACSAATLTFNLTSVNDLPIAADDNFNMLQGESINSSLAINDSDVDDTILTYSLISPFTDGLFELNSNGTFNFLPNLDINGLIELDYQVCDDSDGCATANISIYIEPELINNPPIAENDAVSMLQGTIRTGSVASNDHDDEGDDLTFVFTGVFNSGTFVMNTNGSYVFTPDSDLSGVIQLTYQVCDTDDNCASAVLTITINEMNTPPVASDDTNTMLQGTTLIGNVASNDIDDENDQLIYSFTGNFTEGSFVLNANGSYTFNPNPNLSGEVLLPYQVCDIYDDCDTAILAVTINEVNDPPVAQDDNETMLSGAVLFGNASLNDSDLENDLLTYSFYGEFTQGTFVMNADGSYMFAPQQGLVGVIQLAYQVCDLNNQCANATLTITIEEPQGTNSPPIVQIINEAICEGATWIFDLNEIISDPDDLDENLTVQIVEGEFFVLDPVSHEVTFSGVAKQPGFYSATYQVCDDGDPSLCDQAIMTIEVIAINNIYTEEVYVEFVSCFGGEDGSIEIISISSLGNISYEWEIGGTTNQQTNLESGDYIVEILSDASCSIASSVLFTVSGPNAPLSATIESYNNINEGNDGNIALNIEGGTQPYNVEWTGPNGFVSSEMNLNNLNTAGQYTANVNDGNGCQTQLGVSLVGIEELNDTYSINIVPNPSQGLFKLNLQGAANSLVVYSLFDGQGRMVLSKNVGIVSSTFSEEINGSLLATGVYHLQVLIGDNIQTKRVIIQ